jgi:hypothetical protein
MRFLVLRLFGSEIGIERFAYYKCEIASDSKSQRLVVLKSLYIVGLLAVRALQNMPVFVSEQCEVASYLDVFIHCVLNFSWDQAVGNAPLENLSRDTDSS